MKRVIFYFDGFNFYYGLREMSRASKDWKKFYWIDFVAFCDQFISDGQELSCVKYFTAPPVNTGKRGRQSALLAANKAINQERFQIVKGKYYTKNVNCQNCHSVFQMQEEKRTDVNISMHMITDCFKNNADKLVLVTADSDLITTVQTLQKEFPQKDIKIYFPPKRTSTELFNVCKPVVYLEKNKSKFENAVMNDEVKSEDGTKSYKCPPNWK